MSLFASSPKMKSRAQGCLLGQLAGDALGSLVEFQSPEQIRKSYPEGVRYLADGGTFNTIAGQPTDDSEMALLLARMLVEEGAYDAVTAKAAYVFWIDSGPFDCGNTIAAGLKGKPNPGSQATSSSYDPSHVLKAMGMDDDEATACIRISWSHFTPEVDWSRIAARIKEII